MPSSHATCNFEMRSLRRLRVSLVVLLLLSCFVARAVCVSFSRFLFPLRASKNVVLGVAPRHMLKKKKTCARNIFQRSV